MKFIISVDVNTLTCTFENFEETLNSIGSYVKVNDSFWIVESSQFPNKSSKAMFYNFFEKYTTEHSNILINPLADNCYWNLDEHFSTLLND